MQELSPTSRPSTPSGVRDLVPENLFRSRAGNGADARGRLVWLGGCLGHGRPFGLGRGFPLDGSAGVDKIIERLFNEGQGLTPSESGRIVSYGGDEAPAYLGGVRCRLFSLAGIVFSSVLGSGVLGG